ncbi:MAG: DUF4360 domain-containing protein [Bacteriovoracaceae bacterium]|nr:DUF4360 domain-containing protein [Bacteriovoracaceae bacterium]
MKTIRKYIILTLATLAVLMMASPVRAHEEAIQFSSIKMNGTGCALGTTSTITSPDGSALTLLFDEFMAEVPQYDGDNDNDQDQPGSRFNVKRSNKHCKIGLTANIPEGHKVDSVEISVDFRGATSVERGSMAMFRSSLLNWNGMGRRTGRNQQLIAHKMWNRPTDEDWTVSKTLSIPMHTACSTHGDREVKLSMRNIVGAAMGRKVDPESTSAFIMMDSADLAGKVKIKIYATPCGSHGGNGYRNGLGKNPKCQIGWEYNSRIRRCVRAFPHQGRRGRFKSPRRR